MSKHAKFKVDPKLTALLGEGYRSSEAALKELVDNAWDADADNVHILLPEPFTSAPIIIQDDGSGMIEREVREEYLRIASDRVSRKGDRSILKRRRVKGRKGIGKFAGLLAAHEMRTETWARGTKTTIVVTLPELLAASEKATDLERIQIPITTEEVPAGEHGTRITLSGLNQKLSVPSPEKLKALLVREYGREDDFRIFVNDAPLALDDVPGAHFEASFIIEGAGPVKLRFTISEDQKNLKQPGIAVRAGGKLIGRPSFLGLENDEVLPPKLLKQVYGEIEADGLVDQVTGDWGAIIENSTAWQEIKAQAAAQVKGGIEKTYKSEVNLAKARWEKELQRRLASLPEYRRQYAEKLLDRLLRKLYRESHERIESVVSVMLDAIERDDYWLVLKSIDESARADVARLAGILEELGLVDVAMVAQQCKYRLAFLDEFDTLLANPATLESQVHQAIEKNLWLLGPDHQLVASNKTFDRLIRDWLDKKYKGRRAKNRPDLLLLPAGRREVLLLELKRPSHPIDRKDEGQAMEYRDELQVHVPDRTIRVLVIGGTRDPQVSEHYATDKLTVTTFTSMAAQARDNLAWLLEQLKEDHDEAHPN